MELLLQQQQQLSPSPTPSQSTEAAGRQQAAAPSTCPRPPERSPERGGEDDTAAGSADAAEGDTASLPLGLGI